MELRLIRDIKLHKRNISIYTTLIKVYTLYGFRHLIQPDKKIWAAAWRNGLARRAVVRAHEDSGNFYVTRIS